MPSSGSVCRGPVPKNQLTPSANPSGWHEPQLLQASFDALPLKFRRHDVANVRAENVVVWNSKGREEGELSHQDGMLVAARRGRLAGGDVKRERQAQSISVFIDVTEKLAFCWHSACPVWRITTPLGRLPV